MTPLRSSTLSSAASAGRSDRPPARGLDGVVADVVVTVLLAAVVAALVGAVVFLLWRALPGA